jgi:hypothetical protein
LDASLRTALAEFIKSMRLIEENIVGRNLRPLFRERSRKAASDLPETHKPDRT